MKEAGVELGVAADATVGVEADVGRRGSELAGFLKRVRGAALVALCSVLWAGVGQAAAVSQVDTDPDWHLSERVDGPEGHVLSQRDLPGSSFPAFRLEATLEVPVAKAAAAMRSNLRDSRVSPKNMKKTLIREDGDVLVLYSYIDVPLFADRDITTRAEESVDPETGVHRFDWWATDEGPAPKPGVVRLQKASGSWVFTPLADGRTRAVCESHTEIGGSIPAWLVHSVSRNTAVEELVLLRARLDLADDRSTVERPLGALR